jgi:tetratricopeptide (TPR) repeat protein
MISRSYQRMNNYQAAIDNLYSLLQLSDNVFIKDDIYYYLGWLYLEIGSFKEAQSAFALISKNKTDFQTEKLNERIADSESIRRKSPVTAGFLSMFPGAGYLYCNRYRDAGVSFLITGATAVGAYECFDKELYALGGILSLASLGFYAGSIYGSITSAHKFNTMEQKEFVRDLQREFKPGLWIDKNKNLLIGMTYRF